MKTLSRYSKAIAAFFTSLGTWGVTALAEDANGVSTISGAEWFGLCGVVVATIAVFGVSNTEPEQFDRLIPGS